MSLSYYDTRDIKIDVLYLCASYCATLLTTSLDTKYFGWKASICLHLSIIIIFELTNNTF